MQRETLILGQNASSSSRHQSALSQAKEPDSEETLAGHAVDRIAGREGKERIWVTKFDGMDKLRSMTH